MVVRLMERPGMREPVGLRCVADNNLMPGRTSIRCVIFA